MRGEGAEEGKGSGESWGGIGFVDKWKWWR